MKKNYYETIRGKNFLKKVSTELGKQWILDCYQTDGKIRFQPFGRLFVELKDGNTDIHLFERCIWKSVGLFSEYTEEEFKRYAPNAAVKYIGSVLVEYLMSKGFPKVKSVKYISHKTDRKMIELMASLDYSTIEL